MLTAKPLMFALLSEGDLTGLLALLIGGCLRCFLDVLWCAFVLALLLDFFAMFPLYITSEDHVGVVMRAIKVGKACLSDRDRQ